MIIYQCKMCGGNLNIEEGSRIATCEYCRTQQAVPSTDDEKIATLYNRANHFRRNSEYDKAMGIYEHILTENAHDAEAYWNLVLCKYGIEYVEDPSTKQQMPTINRTQSVSVLQDADYLMALENADFSQKQIYEAEAGKIDGIQKEILRIANNEAPYDIFISYKEKAPDGERTRSSVLAQDIYRHLTKEGYRVFFSRVSLEDKVGQKYEPYIYSALNSAKVMLVIGTEKEEFTAPWVKNEWSRFLVMAREDTEKLLIPCFRDIFIGDLPNEFQILQSQDMSKLGFEQDLLHGIEKIFDSTKKKIEVVEHKQTEADQSVDRLCLSAETYMKLKKYETAYEVYLKITQLYPEDYRGWWGLIQADTREFMIVDDGEGKLNNYKEWFGYVEKLSSLSEYKDKCNQYILWLKKVSAVQVAGEKEKIKSIILICQSEIDERNKLVVKIAEEIKKIPYELEEQKTKITNSIIQKEEEYKKLEQIGKRIPREQLTCKICSKLMIVSFICLLGMIWGFFNFNNGNAGEVIIVAIGILLPLTIVFWVLWWSGNNTISAYNPRELDKIHDEIIKYQTEKKENEEKYNEKKKRLNEERTHYNSEKELYNQKIMNCKKYLEVEEDKIAEILFALNCEKIGVARECDAELLNLRNSII